MYKLTEKENSASKYLFDKVQGLPHSKASFFGHLYNTFFILKKMRASEDTCLAGLYHSVYGTEKIKIDQSFDKKEVCEVIGESAEIIVYYFSLPNRDRIIFENELNLDEATRLSLIQILYANELEQRGHRRDSDFLSYLYKMEKLIKKLSKDMV